MCCLEKKRKPISTLLTLPSHIMSLLLLLMTKGDTACYSYMSLQWKVTLWEAGKADLCISVIVLHAMPRKTTVLQTNHNSFLELIASLSDILSRKLTVRSNINVSGSQSKSLVKEAGFTENKITTWVLIKVT